MYIYSKAKTCTPILSSLCVYEVYQLHNAAFVINNK